MPMSVSISVIVPALNEEKLLSNCLQSLNTQVCDFEYEIIVVANGSTDATTSIAEKYGARVIREKRPGVAMARATGFAEAQGDIIASTDADTVVPSHWLARINQVFANNQPEAVGVGGQWEYVDGPISIRLLIKLVNRIMPYVLPIAPWMWSFSGFNFAVRKDAYKACGGFNFRIPYGEDFDLGRRMRKLGRVIIDYDLLVRTSGMAFAKDPLCIRAVLNYLSLVIFGRTFLPTLVRSKRHQSAR